MKTKYITKVSAVGLKSGDFEHQLEHVNVIVGRSASGKTARLDAIRLALSGGTILGRSSELKTRTVDVMDLARNGHIEVAIIDSDGCENRRRWVRGKNCQNIELGIETPLGSEILLDASQYFSLSDAKKIDYAFSLYPMDESMFSPEAIIAELKNVKVERNTTETELIVNDIAALARGTNEDRIKAKENLQSWLADLIKSLKIRLSASKAAADRMTQTVQGITALAADVPARNPESELAGERTRLQTYRDGLTSLERQLKDVESIVERRAQIQREILELQDDPMAVNRLKIEISELEAEISRIESSPLVLPSEFKDKEPKVLEEQIEAFKKVIEEYEAKAPTKCSTCGQSIHNKEIDIAKDTVSKLQAMYVRLVNAQNRARSERDSVIKGKRVLLKKAQESLEMVSTVGASRAKAEARLSELSLDGKTSPDTLLGEIMKAKEIIGGAETKITLLESQRVAYIQRKADETRNAQALIQHAKDRASVEITTLAIDKLETIQAKMVATAFETILKTVNSITGDIVNGSIEYRDGEIGRWVKDSWIKHEAFSGTEKALTYAGVSLALAKDAPIKILMVDELGRLDAASLSVFLTRMLKLEYEGAIGQFIGCLSVDGPFTAPGVNVIAL